MKSLQGFLIGQSICGTEKYFNMKRILITHGTVPLAQRLGKLLEGQVEVIFASSEPFPEVLKKLNYQKLPPLANPTFVHELLKLGLDESIDYVLPLGKEELPIVQQARVLFEEYGQQLLIPVSLADTFLVEKPEKELPVRILHAGVDIGTGETVAEESFSGAGIVSDSGEEVVLCVV